VGRKPGGVFKGGWAGGERGGAQIRERKTHHQTAVGGLRLRKDLQGGRVFKGIQGRELLKIAISREGTGKKKEPREVTKRGRKSPSERT